MSKSEKIKAIDSKIKQNKGQYDLDKQTARTSALLSRNVSKYETLTGEDVLSEKDLLEKAITMKIFEYLPVGKELKAQTDIANKQHQKLDDTYKFNKTIKKEKPTFKKYNRSNLIYSRISFYSHSDEEEFEDMPPLKGDEEVKEGKGLKILSPYKLLTRLPILLAQMKAGNNSYK